MQEQDLLDIDTAAQRLSLSPWSVRAWIKRGDIRAVRLGRRVLVPASEIARIAADGLPSLRQEA